MDTYVTNQNCGGCHGANHPSGITLSGNATERATYLSCLSAVLTYDPTGLLIDDFCPNETPIDPLGGNHGALTAMAQGTCTDLYVWLQTGVGTPPACP